MMATMSVVWDRAMEFLRDNLAALLPLAMGAVFVPLALTGTLNPLMGTLGPAGNLALGLIVLALSLVTVWGHLAITALALDPPGGRASAVDAANRRILPMLGIDLLLLLGVVLLSLPFGIALALSGLDLTRLANGQVPAHAPNITAMGFAVLYAPVFLALLLWFAARLTVVTPTLLMERRGTGVFARAFVLTRPVQWKLVGVVLLYAVVSTVATTAARSATGGVFGLLLGGGGAGTATAVLTAVVGAAVSTVLSLVAMAFAARLYLAARDAREAIVEGALGRG